MVALATGCLTVLLGCGHVEQIETYTVPKEPKVDAVAETDRMLAAILPADGRAWFFKAVGPISEVDKHEKEINDFFMGLTLAADGRPNWKLPAGWKEEAGNQMRLATIVIPGDKPLEITVTAASWSDAQNSMLPNVNRWRGQLQLPPIGPKQLADVSHEAKAGDRPITIVDMRGQFKTGGMTPPFASGAFGPRATGGRSTNSNLPAGHPPIDATPSLPASHPPIDATPSPANTTTANAPPSADVPKFNAPPSWKPLPAQEPRKAVFAVGEGPQPAQVTLINFPSNEGSLIADPLANINRWRGELGLGEIQKEALASETQAIDVDGQAATYAAMIPDTAKPEQSQAKEATLAAIVKNGDQVWFIKLKGERELVKKRQDEFKSFLKSLKFSHDNEAGHGNK